MKLCEVALNSCWIAINTLEALPTVFVLCVFTPSKGTEAYHLWKRLELVRTGRQDAIQYRTDNGFHIVALGFDLPDDIPYIGFTERQVKEWASKKKVGSYDAVEIEPDDPALTTEQYRQLITKRWDEHNDAQ
jgi:hypothetical protein